MAKKNKLKGKFVIAFDTMCQGEQCVMTEENGKSVPMLYDSYNEAFKEIFNDALSMLENYSAKELKEHIGCTRATVKRMAKVSETDDVLIMELFLNENPDLNTNNETVVPADEFIMNRKAFFTGKGVVITGTKL